MQYGIRLREEPEMSWDEFATLLKGIMPETPLGKTVSIRAEENKEMLSNFTEYEHTIRNEWRNKSNPVKEMSDTEKEAALKKVQNMLQGLLAPA